MAEQLRLPAELHAVPEGILKGFLAHFAQSVAECLSPLTSSVSTRSAFNSTYALISSPDETGIRLAFRHLCRHTACPSPTCQLCLNNPHKACHPTQCLDQQYWVRDDARGGQLVKAKCGADVVVQLFRGSDPQPLLQPDVQLKLYVIPAAAAGEAPLPPLSDPVAGLHLSDEGRPLWVVPGVEPEQDGGLPLGLEQEGECGPGWPLPPGLRFCDKNSTYRSKGLRLDGFRLLVRALQQGQDGATGGAVLWQAASTPFKVTTKKAYDSCRKVEYLYGGQPLTPTTLPHMGSALLNNLKAVFGEINTVGDLVSLVEAAGRHPPTQHQLREVLNMSRNNNKWAAFQHALATKVFVEDSTPRLWWLPSASPAAAAATTGQRGAAPSPEGWGGVGLVWSAHRGQVELDAPAGVVTQLVTSSSALRVSRITPQHRQVAKHQLEQLQQLAVDSWQRPGHPGWRLVTQGLEWVGVDPQQVAAAADSALSGTLAPGERLVTAAPAPASAAVVHTSTTCGGSGATPSSSPSARKSSGSDSSSLSDSTPQRPAIQAVCSQGVTPVGHNVSSVPASSGAGVQGPGDRTNLSSAPLPLLPPPTCVEGGTSPDCPTASSAGPLHARWSAPAATTSALRHVRTASVSIQTVSGAPGSPLSPPWLLAGGSVLGARLPGSRWHSVPSEPGPEAQLLAPPAKRRCPSPTSPTRPAAAAMPHLYRHGTDPSWQQPPVPAMVVCPYPWFATGPRMLPWGPAGYPHFPSQCGSEQQQQQQQVLPVLPAASMAEVVPHWVMCDMQQVQQQQQQQPYKEAGMGVYLMPPSMTAGVGGVGGCYQPLAAQQAQQQVQPWHGQPLPAAAANAVWSGRGYREAGGVPPGGGSHVDPGARLAVGCKRPAAALATAAAKSWDLQQPAPAPSGGGFASGGLAAQSLRQGPLAVGRLPAGSQPNDTPFITTACSVTPPAQQVQQGNRLEHAHLEGRHPTLAAGAAGAAAPVSSTTHGLAWELAVAGMAPLDSATQGTSPGQQLQPQPEGVHPAMQALYDGTGDSDCQLLLELLTSDADTGWLCGEL